MFQKDLLQHKRILITGGGTGLGKASAQRFLELGATVYICGRRHDVLAATEKELQQKTGGSIHSRPCDVREAAAVEEMTMQPETSWHVRKSCRSAPSNRSLALCSWARSMPPWPAESAGSRPDIAGWC